MKLRSWPYGQSKSASGARTCQRSGARSGATREERSATAQTVGTVGVLGLMIAMADRVWGTTPRRGVDVFPEHGFHIGNSVLHLGDIGLFVSALVLAGAFLALFQLTDLGLAMRCAADNRRAATLMGIDPDRTTAVAWFFAGGLAGLGGVLLGNPGTRLKRRAVSAPSIAPIVFDARSIALASRVGRNICVDSTASETIPAIPTALPRRASALRRSPSNARKKPNGA